MMSLIVDNEFVEILVNCDGILYHYMMYACEVIVYSVFHSYLVSEKMQSEF